MAVVVTFLGRLGNNMFQYSLGRLVATELRLALRCVRVRPPVGRRLSDNRSGDLCSLEDCADRFADVPLHMTGDVGDHPVQRFEVYPGSKWSGHTLNVRELLLRRDVRLIRLSGYFQRMEFYRAHKEIIRRWFAISETTTDSMVVSPDDILLNIRRGNDYASLGWELPLSYYSTALEKLRASGRVFVCGTGIDDEVRGEFEWLRPTYFEGQAFEQFMFIQQFSNIVLSNSTFGWWAAWLSNAAHIVAARQHRPGRYAFSGYRDVDLHMGTEQYHEIVVD